MLRYPVASATRTNLDLGWGTVRFTYVSDWYFGHATDAPGQICRLLECGQWQLSLSADGRYLTFQTPAPDGTTTRNFTALLPRSTVATTNRTAWEIELGYCRGFTSVKINGSPVNDDYTSGPLGSGVLAVPPAGVSTNGFCVGSAADGSAGARGYLDQLTTYSALFQSVQFGYNGVLFTTFFGRLGDWATRRGQLLTATDATNGLDLHWLRGWEGDPAANAGTYSLERQTVGQTNWTVVSTNLFTETWRDTTVTAGTYYNYQLDRSPGQPRPTAMAVWRAAPVDARGRAILLVDNTVSNAIASELELFKRDLVADGWLVLATNAPRHSDWTAGYDSAYTNSMNSAVTTNAANAAALKSYLQSVYNLDTNLPNVVFLIGHVTIPYSGSAAEDGHGDHGGAYPTDSWYGDMTGTWTDSTVNLPNTHFLQNYNVPGDGRWDQNTLPLEADGSPGRIELGVGRIDFHLMAPFRVYPEVISNSQDDTEIRVLKLYFDKVKRWRRAQIALVSDYRAWTPDGHFYNLIESVQRLQPRLWGGESLDSGRYAEDMFLATTNYLWGIHGDYGSHGATGLTNEPRYHLANDVALETANDLPRGMFTLYLGSYFGEWFYWDNDLLRVCNGVTNNVLTATWMDVLHHRDVWRADRFHLGAPYATALQDTFAASSDLSCRTTAILGDPFLREHPIASVGSLTLTKVSPNIVLSWPAQGAATDGYRIYRAASTNSATWTNLVDVVSSATGWTNASPGNGTYAYLIKCLSLKTTASGSYTNTSLGTFSSTEVTLP